MTMPRLLGNRGKVSGMLPPTAERKRWCRSELRGQAGVGLRAGPA